MTVGLIIIAGCISDSDSKQNETNITVNSDSASPLNVAEQVDEKAAYPFFGKWVVEKELASGRVSALSNEDIESLIGTTVSYEQSEMKNLKTGEMSVPVYEQNTMSKEDFFGYTYVSLDELHVESATIVEVLVSYESEDDWFRVMSHFFVKDENTLILSTDGVFFEMSRLE